MKGKSIFPLFAFVICFGISLLLPAIINEPYKVSPDSICKKSDPYYTNLVCAHISEDTVNCYNFSPGGVDLSHPFTVPDLCKSVVTLTTRYTGSRNIWSIENKEVNLYLVRADNGWQVLLYGAYSVFYLIVFKSIGLGWFANVLAILAILLVFVGKSYRLALWSSLLTLPLGLTPLANIGIKIPSFDDYFMIYYLGSGYYFWEASFIFLILFCFVKYRESRRDYDRASTT